MGSTSKRVPDSSADVVERWRRPIPLGRLTALVVLYFLAPLNPLSSQETVALRAVPAKDVKITGGLWARRLELNRTVSVPEMLDTYENSNRIANGKLVEAAAYILAKHPDRRLQERVRAQLLRIIDTLRSVTPPNRWKQLFNGELYVAGHLFEAAVAYYQATGDRDILEAAIELADHIDSVFGPGRRQNVSGHEEVKIGLVRLHQLTGDPKYRNLARFFLDARGRPGDGRKLYGEYAQDHEPVVEQREAVGHCVRATYLYTSLADLARLTGDPRYAIASNRLWEDVVFRKIFLTGGVGSHRDHEDFGEPYHLPNLSCWNETCGAIGNLLWNHRLFLLDGDAKNIDVLERILYNGFLAGVSLDGKRYFYQNVLRTAGDFVRQPWYGPNCCPPNVARILASLEGYLYAWDDEGVYVNLFIPSRAVVSVAGTPVRITQETLYPVDGQIRIAVDPETPKEFAVRVRLPGWAQNQPLPGNLYRYAHRSAEEPSVTVNGNVVAIEPEKGFVRIDRSWRAGDVLELHLPMPVRRVLAHESVKENRRRVALERGPLVYCAEGVDNGGNVFNLVLPDDAALVSEVRADLLGGVAVIKGKVLALSRGADGVAIERRPQELMAVPYYAWGNRDEGSMVVWLAREPSRAHLPPTPSLAATSRASSSCGEGTVQETYPGGQVPDVATRFYPHSQSGSGGLAAIRDQIEPTSSADGSCPYLSLRPQEGDLAWAQYDFPETNSLSAAEVYFKDDGEYCLLPRSWRILYSDGGAWRAVEHLVPYAVERDRYNQVTFTTVKTDRVRLEIRLQGQLFEKGELGPPDGNYLKEDITWYEGGVLEWRVH